MNNDLKIYRTTVTLMTIITLVGAFILTIFELAFYDAGTNLFSSGAPSWVIVLFAIAALLFSVVSCLLINSDTFPLTYPEKNSKFTDFAELLCAGILILTFAVQLLKLGYNSDHLTALWLASSDTLVAAVRMLRLSVFLALIASIYFIYSFITEKKNALLAIIFCMWIIAYLLRIYYDMSVIIVDPVRKLTIAALCSMLLFMCAEIRVSVGKPSPRMFVCFGLLAFFFCGVSGISKLVMWIVNFNGIMTQSVYDCFEITFALYVLSRLLAFTNAKTSSEPLNSTPPAATEPENNSAVNHTDTDTVSLTPSADGTAGNEESGTEEDK